MSRKGHQDRHRGGINPATQVAHARIKASRVRKYPTARQGCAAQPFFAALENPLNLVLADDDAVPVAMLCDGRGVTVRSLPIDRVSVRRIQKEFMLVPSVG